MRLVEPGLGPHVAVEIAPRGVEPRQELGVPGRFVEPVDAFVQRFTASVAFDRRLAQHDITASLAHARMLAACSAATRAGPAIRASRRVHTARPCSSLESSCELDMGSLLRWSVRRMRTDEVAIKTPEQARHFLGGPSLSHGSLLGTMYRGTPISGGPIFGAQAN